MYLVFKITKYPTPKLVCVYPNGTRNVHCATTGNNFQALIIDVPNPFVENIILIAVLSV